MDIIKLVLKEARWISAGDWLEKVVEHTTPSGQKRRVKVKSLSPKEQEKYRPKGQPKEKDVLKGDIGKKKEQLKNNYTKHFSNQIHKISKMSFDTFVPETSKTASDTLLAKGLTTGYNIDKSRHSGVSVASKDYSESLTNESKKQIIYHMYKEYPEHGQELLEKLHDAGVDIEYEVSTMASTVLWDSTWDEEKEMQYDKVGDKKVGRSLQYALMFRPKSDEEANVLADKLNELANKHEKNPHASKAISNSWFVPDVRSTGGEYDEYEENYVNYKKSGTMDIMFLSKKKQDQDGFKSSKLFLNKELSQFIK